MKIDINEFRKIAGLNIVVESYDEDDDLTPSERALIDKADKDLAKKGVKVANVDADKDLEHISTYSDKKGADEDTPSSNTTAQSTKKDAAHPTPTPDDKKLSPRIKAKEWLAANPNGTRKEFMSKIGEWGMGTGNAGAFWQGVSSKAKKMTAVTEGYYFTHPNTASFVLGENREMNQYQWIDPTVSEFPMVIAETKEQADKIEEYLTQFKNQRPVVTHFNLSDD